MRIRKSDPIDLKEFGKPVHELVIHFFNLHSYMTSIGVHGILKVKFTQLAALHDKDISLSLNHNAIDLFIARTSSKSII